VEERYGSTFSLTPAIDGVVVQRHAPTTLPPGKTQYPLYRRLSGTQGWSGLRIYFIIKNLKYFIHTIKNYINYLNPLTPEKLQL
jgi:hypothetical protein